MALIALACCVAYVSTEDETDKRILERKGHFAKISFTDTIYGYYANGLHLNPGEPQDALINARPNDFQCVEFLYDHSEELNLKRVVDFIMLDACLGVIFDRSKEDSSDYDADIQALAEKQHLQELYHTTRIERLNNFKILCISNLLVGSVSGRAQYSERLNDHYIQLFAQFGGCIRNSGMTKKDLKDPYVSLIVNLVSKELKEALQSVIQTLKALLKRIYKGQVVGNLIRGVKSVWNDEAYAQMQERIPDAIRNLLSVLLTPNENLDYRGVHQRLQRLFEGEKFFETNLNKLKDPADKNLKINLNIVLDEIAEKATNDIFSRYKSSKITNDGSARYKQWRTELCAPFRISDDEASHDFALKVQRLVDITKFADLFGLGEAKLLNDILVSADKPAGLYLSLVFCNFLDFTTASLPTNHLTNDLQKKDTKQKKLNERFFKEQAKAVKSWNQPESKAASKTKSFFNSMPLFGAQPEVTEKQDRPYKYTIRINRDRRALQRWPLLAYI